MIIRMYLKPALITLVLISIIGCSSGSADARTSQAAKSSNPPDKAEFEFRNISGGSLEQAEEVLHNSLVGHLIVYGEYPYSTPVNFVYEDKFIYFPLRKDAEKKIIDIIAKDKRVFFAVDNYTSRLWHSIHIFGNAVIIDANDYLKRYQEVIGNVGFTYDKKPDNMLFVRITADIVTVRLNYTIPHWYLGKLKRSEVGKLTPVLELPVLDIPGSGISFADNDTTFAENVEFVGLRPIIADIILRSSHSGRINTLGDDGPYSVPLNCSFPKGKIYIHSKKNGLKVLNLQKNPNVTFDVEWLWNGKDWLTVTVEGKAKHLPFDKGIEAMQYFSVFLSSPDGFIPSDFIPEPGKKIGSERMTQRMAVIEITPERVITRSVPIPEQWRSRMPAELSR